MAIYRPLPSYLTLPLGFLLLVGGGAAAVSLSFDQRSADGWVRHTLEVESALDQVRIAALRAETIGREGGAAGHDERVAGIGLIRQTLTTRMNGVTALTSDNPRQQRILPILREALDTQLAHLVPTGSGSAARDEPSANPVRRHDAQRVAMLLDATQSEEKHLLKVRSARSARLQGEAVAILVACSLLATMLAILLINDQRRRLAERRTMADALAASERRLRLITEEASDMISLYDADGTCLFMSPSSLKTLGRDPQTMIGHHHYDFIPAEYHALLDHHHAEPRKETLRFRMSHNDGTLLWIEISSRFAEFDGKPCIIVIARDVSSRVDAEAELEKARNEAEAAAKTKSSFLANMSHEIRTPMNGVIGFTELILASDLTAEQRHHATLIADSGHAMMRLLNDILDLSKVEAGQMTVTQEPFDLLHTLRACVKLMTPTIAQRGLGFSCELDHALPRFVVGDGLRLRQIVLNLLGNAVKFTAQGGVKLRAWPTGLTDGAAVTIEIADTGIGIAPERQRAIFEQFVQADSSISPRFGGTGLGLAISLQLARLMGGDLRLHSRPGEGTSFFLDLPLYAAASLNGIRSPQGPADTAGPVYDAKQALSAPRILGPRLITTT